MPPRLKKEDFSVVTEVCRTMSIQSSVVYGYVGNKAAVFPLQLHGIEVDPIHTCQFSNHAGYDSCTGQKTNGDEINTILTGMRSNNLLQYYTHIMTGYMTTASCLEASAALIKELKEDCSERLYLCDPVMGDQGELYVPEVFVSLYRDQMLPLADVITPNQTEIELLSGIKITDLSSARAACRVMHAKGPKLVIITSMELENDTELKEKLQSLGISGDHSEFTTIPDNFDEKYCFIGTGRRKLDNGKVTTGEEEGDCIPAENPYVPSEVRTAAVEVDGNGSLQVQLPYKRSHIHILASEMTGTPENPSYKLYYVKLPQYDTYVSGTGDLTTAMLLCWLQRGKGVQKALENALAAVQSVLRATLLMKRFELALIQAQTQLILPDIRVTVVELEHGNTVGEGRESGADTKYQ